MTTSNDFDQIRRDIAATRAELSNDVNALSKVTAPSTGPSRPTGIP